jgi:hypothetical protein
MQVSSNIANNFVKRIKTKYFKEIGGGASPWWVEFLEMIS